MLSQSRFPLEELKKFLRKNWKLLDLTPESEFSRSSLHSSRQIDSAMGGYVREKVVSRLLVGLGLGFLSTNAPFCHI